jgi:methionine-rich copper-binding protein CopC
MRKQSLIYLTFALVLAQASLPAQQLQKVMTNEDVLALVRAHKPESVILSQIQSRPSSFDTSAHEIIRLTKAGVTENVLNAMMAAQNKGESTASSAKPGTGRPADTSSAMPVSKSHMPKLYLMRGGAPQELPLEKTQLAATKTKPTSMKSLAADAAVTQGLQTAVNTVAMDAAMHTNSTIGGSMVGQAGGIFSGIMSHRTPTVTYVWGVPNPASSSVLQTVSPSFSVDFSRAIGVTVDEYQPAIVKLTPAQNTCRIVGATQGKADAQSSPAADWQVYSHFLEERVATHAERLEAGKYKVSPASELQPGEYAVVLRPISKDKKFSGGDVARAQGDGLMFDLIWTFQISDEAE